MHGKEMTAEGATIIASLIVRGDADGSGLMMPVAVFVKAEESRFDGCHRQQSLFSSSQRCDLQLTLNERTSEASVIDEAYTPQGPLGAPAPIW